MHPAGGSRANNGDGMAPDDRIPFRIEVAPLALGPLRHDESFGEGFEAPHYHA